jgi:DNA polymerase-3 subunit delta
MPLLGGRRLIIVRGLLGRFEAKRRTKRTKAKAKPKDDSDGASKEDAGPLGEWQTVVDALPDLPESTVLALIDGKIGARNPLLAALKKDAEVQQFTVLKKGELAGWIRERAELYGARLEGRAIAAMADLVGGDLWVIDGELRKLATYAGDDVVSEADVRSMVSQVREANAFALADAIVEGRYEQAVALFQRLLADGDAPLRLLALIARQYRLLIQARELLDQRLKPAEIGTRLGVHGFVAQRILQQAPPYTSEQLRAAYGRLLEADLSIKRGIYDDETALELLIVELANAYPSRRRDTPGYSRPQAGRGPAPARAGRG